ncbi:MAG: hypothetical protein NW208_06040 [Bryobacter sp.]|nr:hypothetical protein [Bryobacter sp.]
MNRKQLQGLALTRLEESQQLQQAKFYGGSYYLAGYCVECALKACIARKTRAGDFPDKKLAEQSYTHDLRKLMQAAGLDQLLLAECRQNIQLQAN